MSVAEEKVVNQLQFILDLWKVTYNVADQKYIAKTNSMAVLNSDQIEEIRRMNLFIFSVQKSDDTLIVRFSSGGGY